MSIESSPYDFHLKTGDTSPAIERQLTDDVENPVNLTPVGVSVTFVMTAPGATTPTVSSSATIADGETGVVRYEWDTEDTATAGTYNAEFEVSWPDGSSETFPNSGYISVRITPDLGGSA